ncbi:hypothetical protein [Fuchsiella alkaliacetigena]|uniref:hypothetical protein n=1 Tax=Fuchsiella alkaliacetigena TaxID=957042 RepID=UPI00200B27BF|nr:hypothetical protein [Fuchsiella alkaliacetigena]MCK8824305.1 hypothetical protein [Fuchsiella alkaliacetigena]
MERVFKLSLLVFLISIIANPVLAEVDISGEVRTIYDKAYYGSEEELIGEIWAHPELLDLNIYLYNERYHTTEDILKLPQNEFFKQEYAFRFKEDLNEQTDFQLDILARSHFIENKRQVDTDSDKLAERRDPPRDLELYRALLKVEGANYDLAIGDLVELKAEDYFLHRKDLKGLDMQSDLGSFDLRTFHGGHNPDYLYENDPNWEKKYSGLVLSRDLRSSIVTGKYYFVNNNELVNLALATETEFTQLLSGEAEIVYNTSNSSYNDKIVDHPDDERSDLLARAALTAQSDQATLSLGAEQIGKDFQLVYADRLKRGVTAVYLEGSYKQESFSPRFKLEAQDYDYWDLDWEEAEYDPDSFEDEDYDKEKDYLSKKYRKLVAGVGADYKLSQQTDLKADYKARWRDDTENIESQLLFRADRSSYLRPELIFNNELITQLDTEELNFIYFKNGVEYSISERRALNFNLSYLYGEDKVRDQRSDGNRLYIDYILKF